MNSDLSKRTALSFGLPTAEALLVQLKTGAVAASLSLTLLTPLKTLATTQNMHLDTGSTKFLAVGHPSFLKIRGEGKGPQGDLEVANGQVRGQLSVDVTSFSTGIEMRDHHMKERYLETGKFPTATLVITKANVGEADSFTKDIDFEGVLTLHGTTRPVKGQAHVERTADTATFNAKFPIKITDYKIDIPTYAGIKIADDVSVEVDSKVKVASAPSLPGTGTATSTGIGTGTSTGTGTAVTK